MMRSTKIRVGITPSFERNINKSSLKAGPSEVLLAQHRLQGAEQHCTHSSEAPALPEAWFPLLSFAVTLQAFYCVGEVGSEPLSILTGLSILPSDRGVPLHDATSGNTTFAMSPSV